MRFLSCALAVLLVTFSEMAHTQGQPQRSTRPDADVVYDWSTGGKRSPALRAGQSVRVRVVNSNPLCYTVGIDVQVTDAAVNVSELMNVISGTQSTTTPEPPEIKRAEGQSGQAPALDGGAQARDALAAAESALTAARAFRAAAETERAEALYITTVVNAPPCEAGRNFNFGSLLARWRALKAASAPAPVLSAGWEQLRGAHEALDRARNALAAVGPLPEALKAWAGDLGREHDALRDRVIRLKGEFPTLAVAVGAAGARLDVLSAETYAEDQVSLGHEAERVKVTIRSYPLAGSGASGVDDIVDEIRVQRRFRAFVSTGVLVTTVEQRQYEQVHRQAFDGAGQAISDSTYLTYASTEGGTFNSLSPAVQLNVSFAAEPFSALVSFGATPRTVNKSVGVEPFFGISAALLDRLVGTFGVHFGRQEYLLLGNPSEVEGRPVPSSITRVEAVGTRWREGFFLSFSIRP